MERPHLPELWHRLALLGHEADVVTDGEVPEFYIEGWTLGRRRVKLFVYEGASRAECERSSNWASASVVPVMPSIFLGWWAVTSIANWLPFLAPLVVSLVLFALLDRRSKNRRPRTYVVEDFLGWGKPLGELVRFQEERPAAVYSIASGIIREYEEWQRKGLIRTQPAKHSLMKWQILVNDFVDDCNRLPTNQAIQVGEHEREWIQAHMAAKAELKQIDQSFMAERDVP
jgi:hypothetical protein